MFSEEKVQTELVAGNNGLSKLAKDRDVGFLLSSDKNDEPSQRSVSEWACS